MSSNIIIDGYYFLEEVSPSHLKDIIVHLNNPSIEKYMLKLPSPYLLSDAEAFYTICQKLNKEHGKIMHYHILNSKREAIGGLGLKGKYGINASTDEIGYWLSESYWNKGIMTKVLTVFTDFLNKSYHLKNPRSCCF